MISNVGHDKISVLIAFSDQVLLLSDRVFVLIRNMMDGSRLSSMNVTKGGMNAKGGGAEEASYPWGLWVPAGRRPPRGVVYPHPAQIP